jgi:purine-binding chemotaxis protein CheW
MAMAQNSTLAHDVYGDSGNENAQFFTFSLNNEEYAVDILSVVEVKVWEEVTVMPDTPRYVKGVLNLRGTIVPIIDLRVYYGIESIDYDAATVILVLKLSASGSDQMIGLVVDSVSDVMNISVKQVHKNEEFDMLSHTDSIIGVATLDAKNIIMLDPSKLMTDEQFNDLGSKASTASSEDDAEDGKKETKKNKKTESKKQDEQENEGDTEE